MCAGGGGNEWKLADQAAEVAKKAAGMSFPGMVITEAEIEVLNGSGHFLIHKMNKRTEEFTQDVLKR